MTEPPDRAAELMQSQGRALRALARSIAGGAEDADDVVQDACAMALERPPAGGATAAWLAAVVRNLARRRRRDRRRRGEHEARRAGDAPTLSPPAADLVAEVQMHRDLAEAVLALPEPYRQAVVLRFWHELPPRRIASRTGTPVATVKTHLQRGLAMLRHRLDQRYGERSSWLAALLPIAWPQHAAPAAAAAATPLPTVLVAMNLKNLVLGVGAATAAGLLIWSLVRADAQGVVPAERATESTPRIAALAPDEVVTESAGRDAADPAPGARQRVIADEPTCAVVARIVDDRTGAPLEGAFLRLYALNPSRWWNPPHPESRSDEDGFVQVRGAWPTKAMLPYPLATAGHSELATCEIALSHDVHQTIVDGRLDLGTIRLERGVAVAGVVRTADGDPLTAPARLMLWDPEAQVGWKGMLDARTVGHTSTDGSFVLAERVMPARDGELWLAAISEEGIGWTPLGVSIGQEWLDRVAIQLRPCGGLRVRVLDAAGSAVVGAAVTAVPHFPPVGVPRHHRDWSSRLLPSFPEFEALLSRRTDTTGHAALTLPLPPAPYRDHYGRYGYLLRARADGHPTAMIEGPAPVRDGCAEVEIRLVERHSVAIRGRVITPDGEAVRGILVSHAGAESTTDPDGRYELAPRTHENDTAVLTLEGPDHPRSDSTVKIPAGVDMVEHDVVVHRRAAVTGRVVDQHGAPIAGVAVLLGVAGGVHYESTPKRTGPDGRFAFPNARADEADLWVRPPEPRLSWENTGRLTVDRRDGTVVVLRRSVDELVDLVVHVADGVSGQPLGPSKVELSQLDPDRDGRSVQPRIELGAVTWRQIRPGHYRIVAQTTDGRRGERKVRLEAGSPDDVRLDLWQPGSVVCSVDWSAVGASQQAASSRFLAVLQANHEDSYAVDLQGTTLPLAPNTLLFRRGEDDVGRLLRVTPNVPRRLSILGDTLFGEAVFTVPPGGETQVVLRPMIAGFLRLQGPAQLPADRIEVDIADEQGTWHPEWTTQDGTSTLPRLSLRRPPGDLRWRLRIHAEDGTIAEHTGTATIRPGETIDVHWPAR